jgi:predicted NBD/HSP70 family sugar kinase
VGARGPVACSCGNHDCWEAFASGRAAVARYVQAGGDAAAADGRQVDFAQVIDRALAGEARAADAITETAHYLGIGISNLIVGLSPEAVVVGGPIARAWPLVGDALSQTIQRSVRRGLPSALIMPSVLGDHPTLMGAISLVLARKFASVAAA